MNLEEITYAYILEILKTDKLSPSQKVERLMNWRRMKDIEMHLISCGVVREVKRLTFEFVEKIKALEI